MENKKNQKEYDKFLNEQFKILEGHFQRCLLRCYNKLIKLKLRDK